MSQVIVVGGGLAGLSAAHTVIENGGRVLLLDKVGARRAGRGAAPRGKTYPVGARVRAEGSRGGGERRARGGVPRTGEAGMMGEGCTPIDGVHAVCPVHLPRPPPLQRPARARRARCAKLFARGLSRVFFVDSLPLA